jgi:beta-lactamase class A
MISSEIERIAEATRGEVGIASRHVESGWEFVRNPDYRFHMASVGKLPVARHLLSLVDRGEVKLDQLIEIPPDAECESAIAQIARSIYDFQLYSN